MGFTDLFQDLYASLSFTELHAEALAAAPAAKTADVKDAEPKDKGDESEEGGDEEKEGGEEEEEKDEGEDGEKGGDEEGGDDAAEAEEEEDEEEEAEEPEDPKPKIEEECANSADCAPAKHHYEECVERVTEQHSDPKHKGPKEDCIEEFFHLQHCATQCAAPKLFRQLK